MQTLSKDILEQISFHLSGRDLLTIEELFTDHNFWKRRFKRDFPNLFQLENILFKSNFIYHDVYISLWLEIEKSSKSLTEIILSSYGNQRKFLSEEYEKHLVTFFDRFYSGLLDQVGFELGLWELNEMVFGYIYDNQNDIFENIIYSCFTNNQETDDMLTKWLEQILCKELVKTLTNLDLLQYML